MHFSIQMTCHVDIISKTFYMVNKILEMLNTAAALFYMGLTGMAIASTNEKRPDSTCLLLNQIYMFAVTHFNKNESS